MISLESLRELASDAFPDVERITVIHLLVAWARHDDGELANYLEECGVGLLEVAIALEPLLGEDDPVDRELIIACVTNIDDSGGIMGVHLIKALLDRPKHRLSRLLASAGLDFARLSNNLDAKGKSRPSALATLGVALRTEPSELLPYGRNLTKLAIEGAFAELAELPEDIIRLEEVLLRKRKGNPILTGPAGIGKTARVELLARNIVMNPASPLKGWTIIEVSMGKLVAGTKYRGEFEDRFEQVLQAVCDNKATILFIDEIHLLLGAGRAEGAAMDGANLIKPYLARDLFRLVGATTDAEYQRYIARDEALARRFQKIGLEEPTQEVLKSMVFSQAASLRAHHGISVSDDAIDEAIALTDLHLTSRRQPDKSVDLLDSAMVAARREGRSRLEGGDLRATLARMTGLPVTALEGADKKQLMDLARRLKTRVIGQDTAVDRVARTLIQRRLALGGEDRPLGVFLFVGDTGMGKTELALSVAEEFFNNPKRVVRIDLAAYADPGSVNKLIGAPRGYMGSEEGGTLMAGLATWPSCVLLFDELEKAHPEVHNLLLGLLDTGRITCARGEVFDLRQSVIIMTSNAVTSRDMEKKGIGFGGTDRGGDLAAALGATLPREFLARIDEVIPFQSLDDQAMRAILILRLREAEERLNKQGIRLEYEASELAGILLRRFTERQHGARGLAKLLEREILQPLAMSLLTDEKDKVTPVRLDADFFHDAYRLL